jgi:hypothetical protein
MLWLIAHAVFHLWEVAVGISSPSVFPRDFLQSPCRRSSGRCLPSRQSISRAPREPHPLGIRQEPRPTAPPRDITLFCRIDTLDEVDYFRHGGILHFVLRQLLAQAEPAGHAD